MAQLRLKIMRMRLHPPTTTMVSVGRLSSSFYSKDLYHERIYGAEGRADLAATQAQL